MESTKCKRSHCLFWFWPVSSTSVLAQDAFSYAKGSATWAHTKSDYIGGKDGENCDFGGLSLISKSFTSNVLRPGSAANTPPAAAATTAWPSPAWGMGSTPLSTGLNLYGETGLMGYSLERELASDVNHSGWDTLARKKSGSLYGEVGLRYDIGAVELSTGYRYANMTDDMHDFKAGRPTS